MSDIFQIFEEYQFGQIHFKYCQKTGMKAIIAIHNTHLGPSLGGCRFIEYNDSDSAILDAMRLARGMSYKAAMANLKLGGGKAVIIKPNGTFSRQAYMESFGEFVQSLGGQYITALDAGTELSDMEVISTKTNFLASSDKIGDPSPSTAQGVIQGIIAACQFKFGSDDLNGMHMAIQGLGHVGLDVAKQLQAMGVTLTVADVDPKKPSLLEHVAIAHVDDILNTDCDVLIPCAYGGLFHNNSIPNLRCQVIAGAANNQLLDVEAAYELQHRNILFTPDYIINAGGLIYAAGRYFEHALNTINQDIMHIKNNLLDIFQNADQQNLPPSVLVDAEAKKKIGLQ